MGAIGGEGGWWAGQREWRWEPGISGCRGVEELLAPRAHFWIQVCSWPHCQCSLTAPPTPPHRPKYKGKYCVGERKRFRLCSLQACPAGRPSFRQVQCSRFDATLYKGQLHTWVPVVNDGESGCLRDTDVRGVEGRGPKACPVTPVLSAGLPLTPSGSWGQPCRHDSPVEPPARH